MRKFSLNTIEMVESPSQGVKNSLVVSWVYMCPYSVFKALTTYLVYKAFNDVLVTFGNSSKSGVLDMG